jgi:hypothetical protein
MLRRIATPSDQAAMGSFSNAPTFVGVTVFGSFAHRPARKAQVIEHLRLVRPEFLEKILGQRLGSGQPEPIAPERDRATGALNRLDEGKSAHGDGLAAVARCARLLGGSAQSVPESVCWAVPLVSFRWRLVSSRLNSAPNSPALSGCWSDWAVWSVLET